MINIVYVDVYFCFNFLMDFFVLYLLCILSNNKPAMLSCSLSSIIGAFYGTFILIMDKGGIVQNIFTYILIPCLMVVILFKNLCIRNIVKRVMILYLIVFILSGLIYALYYSFEQGKNLVDRAFNAQIGNVSIWVIGTIIIVIFSIIKCFRDCIHRDYEKEKNKFNVKIRLGEKEIEAIGLRDTGNQLIEPITRKSVFIVEEKILNNINLDDENIVYIPFHSVGKEHGLMRGFIADYIVVEKRYIKKPIIGIHKGSLSGQNEYNMILPPNI